tara:strand:+ start:74 stop:496 length:423 start_codon:yes stop_codon:yes gene_type:complete
MTAGDTIRACTRFESQEACESFCIENNGTIITEGVIRNNSLRYEGMTLCLYRPELEGDTPISPTVTINEELVYTLDEVYALQRELAAQEILVFPIRQILNSNREQEASICTTRNGTPYFIEVSNNNIGIANPRHIVCVKN